MRTDITVINPDGQRAVLQGAFDAVGDPIPPPPPSGETHAYFEALAVRPDCVRAYSLRDAAEVNQMRAPKDLALAGNMAYVYPTDPDPRRQDATKITIPEGQMGPGVELRMPIGASGDQHVLLTFDHWWGDEFRPAHSKLDLHKECPLALDAGILFLPMRTSYSAAQQAVHTQPSGGPYVAMCYIQGKAAGPKPPWWSDGMTGFPRVRMPADAPYKEQRGYTEGLAPASAEMGIVGDRWHRFWHDFERAPEEDWTTATGIARNAFRYSMWMADTVREPMRVFHDAIISQPATNTTGITAMALHMGAGNSNVNTKYVGRGDLIAYSRNWVVLHGTSKSDVPALLQKPVA